jgi:hypothetical protein
MLILAESAPSESVINDFACPIGESEMDQFDSATDWSQVVAPYDQLVRRDPSSIILIDSGGTQPSRSRSQTTKG